MIEMKKAKAVGQVGAAVCELFETIDKIEATVDTLEKQLSPILGSPRVKETKEGIKEEEKIVPLASDLRQAYSSLQTISARLSEASERLEL